MTASTDACRALANQFYGGSVDDNKTALAGGAQASSPRLLSRVTRFTKVVTAADSCQLPNLGTLEAGGQCRIVVNDTANAVAVFPAVGETINALAANTALSVPAGQSAIFVAGANLPLAAQAILTNWRAAVIP